MKTIEDLDKTVKELSPNINLSNLKDDDIFVRWPTDSSGSQNFSDFFNKKLTSFPKYLLVFRTNHGSNFCNFCTFSQYNTFQGQTLRKLFNVD